MKAIAVLILTFLFLIAKPVNAIVDPLATANNKYGIHLIQSTDHESSPAAQLVNSSGGDWGYITVLVESKNRDVNHWQNFFNDLRRRHLIPIVRLATEPQGDFWKRPYEGEEIAWADFLDNLIWPTKNRYVIIYNEPNHGKEWGNFVDPKNYAETLDKTIAALKKKNEDFFVLNAGLDASAPQKAPNYMDELNFLQEMEDSVPGIFNKLDGWVSHSYPNPGFIGSPSGIGRGTVRTYFWELQALRNLGLTKNLPVFITETGWKHAEGINLDRSLPSVEAVAEYYKTAFQTAWDNSRIVAITPFLLSYQQAPFDHFSFKKYTGEPQNQRILGITYPDYYPMYQTIVDLPKVAGKPVQDIEAQLVDGEVYKSIVAGENYQIHLTFKNIGQSIWNEYENVELRILQGAKELGLQNVAIPLDKKIEPGQDYTFNLNLHAPLSGQYKVSINLFRSGIQFDSNPLVFSTEVKSPVILKVHSSLKWKEDSSGEYILKIGGVLGEDVEKINLNKDGESSEIEARYLLPGYTFKFTLEKPYYKPKTVEKEVISGVNNLEFEELEPNIWQAISNPLQLWKLLPFGGT